MNGIFFDLQTVRARDLGATFGGILSDGKLSGCALSYSGVNLTIARGYYIAKGRLIEIDSAETLRTATTAANGYGRLRLAIDLSIAASESSFTQSKFEWDYATTNNFPALTQNDINDGANTAYHVEICRVSFANSRITGIVSQIGNAGLKVSAHASTHATDGSDPITPASIGAASANHTHTPASIGAASANHTHTPASIGAATASHTHAPADIGAQAARLTFTSKSVATSAWASNSTYTDFPYRAAVACTGVTAAMFAEVVLSPADATSGNFAPVCQTYAGGVYLYAKAVPDAAITIPTIIVWR